MNSALNQSPLQNPFRRRAGTRNPRAHERLCRAPMTRIVAYALDRRSRPASKSSRRLGARPECRNRTIGDLPTLRGTNPEVTEFAARPQGRHITNRGPQELFLTNAATALLYRNLIGLCDASSWRLERLDVEPGLDAAPDWQESEPLGQPRAWNWHGSCWVAGSDFASRGIER